MSYNKNGVYLFDNPDDFIIFMGILQKEYQKNQSKLNELNNKTLDNINYYKHNESLNHAFNRLHEIVITNKFKSFDLIEQDINKLENTFKVNPKGLLKKVILNHFPKWQNEILLTPEPETDQTELIEKISNRILRRFKDKRQPISNLNSFLEQEQEIGVIKKSLKDNEFNLNEQDIINYMLSLSVCI